MKSEKNHVKDKFLDWFEDQLTKEEKRSVQLHLQHCENCAAYYRTMRSLMEDPKPGDLPTLEKDPFLPTRIKATNDENISIAANRLFGLKKSMAGFLVLSAVLIRFLLGQQLVYTSNYSDLQNSSTSIEELYYEGITQPNLGSKLEQFAIELEGSQQ